MHGHHHHRTSAEGYALGFAAWGAGHLIGTLIGKLIWIEPRQWIALGFIVAWFAMWAALLKGILW